MVIIVVKLKRGMTKKTMPTGVTGAPSEAVIPIDEEVRNFDMPTTYQPKTDSK